MHVESHVKKILTSNRLTGTVYAFLRQRYCDHLFNKRCRRLRKYGYKIVCQLHERLTGAGLPYFADWGTLLGIVREHAFIKHDDDLDFQVPPVHPDPFEYVKVLQRIEGLSFRAAFEWRGKINQLVFDYHGIDVDFFFMYDEAGSVYSQSYWQKPNAGYRLPNEWTPKRFACPEPREIESFSFHGISVNVPNNYDAILTAEYGQWRIPVKGFRGNANDKVRGFKGSLVDLKVGLVPREEPKGNALIVGIERVRELSVAR